MMYVAWQHNPQGEFHDTAGINWLNWLAIGFSWFIPSIPVCAVLIIPARLVIAALDRRNLIDWRSAFSVALMAIATVLSALTLTVCFIYVWFRLK